MYAMTIMQEANLRKFALEKELIDELDLSVMVDKEVRELVFKYYVPVIIEQPQSTEYKMQKDFFLIYKEDFEKYATLIQAKPMPTRGGQ